jgi:hypothetical protein
VSRRAVLASLATGAVGLAAAGCAGVGVPGRPARPAAPSPDVHVAAEAIAAITATRDLVRRTAGRYVALRPTLTPLVAMHDAHLHALDKAVATTPSASPTPVPVPPRRAAVRADVLQAEQQLGDTLTRLALAAESGAFARLLASMVASIGQHTTGLAG